ncbi:MAG: ATP-binding cassette domain-containing protein [Alphaproteobacteria bacterium]|nr:MAG: ATP-binding cassette domain-containing protein [Alphaproteobacteria bacterium]
MTMIPSPETLVKVESISHFYGESDSKTQVLFDNNLSVGAGEITIMTGPSGSGKTTLLTLIGGLREVQAGALTVLGTPLTGISRKDQQLLRRRIGFIFQLHNLFESLTAIENVLMATRIAGVRDEVGRAQGIEVLKRLGLGHRIDYKPRALSGGQRQRVAIARALVNRPKLILADEPTAALDKASGRDVVDYLKELTTECSSAVIMVTHDHRVLDTADRVVNMIDGRIVSNTLVKQAIEICEFLRRIELFIRFSPTELGAIADQMTVRYYKQGDPLIQQNDIGEEFFILGSGEVDVLIDQGSGPGRVSTLGAGSAFGERALLTGERRAASIIASQDCKAYVLSKTNFDAAVKGSPDFRTQLQRMYLSR